MKEALKLALEALINHSGNYKLNEAESIKHNKAVDAIEAALAQPAQEPVLWIDEEKEIIYWHNTHETDDYHGFKRTTPLYTTPQQRPWVGLTEEERDAITDKVIGFNSCCGWEDDYTKAIETKLKEKNA
jgi:hypothetical protein